MRVLVLGAGGPAGVNTCRALLKAGHEVLAADRERRHLEFVVAQLGEPPSLGFLDYASLDAVNDAHADVVLPQPDSLVWWLSIHRDAIDAKTFLPAHRTIEKCQDKKRAVSLWEQAGLSSGAIVFGPETPDYLKLAEDRFGLPFWLRASRGAGAKGAILVEDLRQAYHWMRFWELSGERIWWMAQEYLPGRDIAWTGIYYHGELVTSFARERLEYLYPHLTPTGLTGTPTIARVIHDQQVNETAEAAVAAVDDEPHGIMSVDLREDQFGNPRPTEINAGRGFTTLGLWSLYATNFLDIAVRAATGSGYIINNPNGPEPERNVLPEGLTLYRHIDAGHRFVMENAKVAA